MPSREKILGILDKAAEAFVFPMLDNGYIYPAAARLSCFAGTGGWALVFETFGYSPRAGVPDLCVTAIGEGLIRHETADSFVSSEAFDNFERNNRSWRQDFFHPVDLDGLIDEEHGERLIETAVEIGLRDGKVPVPPMATLQQIEQRGAVADPLSLVVVTRGLAALYRDVVLATPGERRTRIQSDWETLITLDEWRHPDVIDFEALPSRSLTMQSLADVISAHDPSLYVAEKPNTHWSNWPDGGTL